MRIESFLGIRQKTCSATDPRRFVSVMMRMEESFMNSPETSSVQPFSPRKDKATKIKIFPGGSGHAYKEDWDCVSSFLVTWPTADDGTVSRNV